MIQGLAISVLILILAVPASAEELRGRVVAIKDGDIVTLYVEPRQRVPLRLAEIDAPKKDQPYGQDARHVLSSIALGKEARVEITSRDRYGRPIGRLYVLPKDASSREIDVSAAMVERGAAWVFEPDATDETLIQLQAAAQGARRGLWAQPLPELIPLWRWGSPTRNETGPR